MKLTNNTGLPESIVKIAERCINSHPDMGERKFSVTEALKSVRQIVLARRYSSVIERDVQDTFSMWNGTAIHDMLENSLKGNPDWMTETRLEMPWSAITDSFTLSGEFDLLDIKNNVLWDYKTTKIATIDNNRKLKEDKWLRQLYLYAEMIEKVLKRPRPEKACILAMATDWSKRQVGLKAGYPDHPIQILEWDLNDESFRDKVKAAVSITMESAQHYLDNPDEELPKCSMDDCWCNEDWAIMKKGNKRAKKVFSSEEAARDFLRNMDSKEYRLYHRISDFNFCRYYCNYSEYCSQWKKNCNEESVLEDITDEDYIPF